MEEECISNIENEENQEKQSTPLSDGLSKIKESQSNLSLSTKADLSD